MREQRVVVEPMDSEASWPGFKSYLCLLCLMRSGADYLNVLCLSLLMSEMWKVVFPEIAVRIKKGLYI